MSRDGNGNYSIPNTFSSGTTISSSEMNSNFSDLATAMTASIAKDGQTTPTANLPMGNFKHTGVAAAAARTDYARAGEVQAGSYIWPSVSGTDTVTWTTTFGPAAYAAGQTVRWAAAATNTGAVTVNWNSLGAKSLVSPTGLPLVAGNLVSGQIYEATYDGTDFVLSASAVAREVLTANRTYYVRTDGSDSNNGLTNSSGGAFLTIQKAINVASGLDGNNYTITIKLGNSGTWTEALTTNQGCPNTIILEGDTSTPANTIISVTSADAIVVAPLSYLQIQYLEIRTTTSGSCFVTKGGARGAVSTNVRFGACAGFHICATYGSNITCDANYNVTGSANAHWSALLNGSIQCSGRTVTISGTPAFSYGFAYAVEGGVIEASSNSYSGSATGPRYGIYTNGVVETYGAGATALPGDTAGSTATGGQYA